MTTRCLPERKLSLCTTADLILDAPSAQPVIDAFFRHHEHVDTMDHDEADALELLCRLTGDAICSMRLFVSVNGNRVAVRVVCSLGEAASG